MTQHLNSLSLRRMRGLQEVELRGLGRVNLLVGGNNSGKTTVLEAVSLCCNARDPRTWVRVAGMRDPGLGGALYGSPGRRPMERPLEQLRWLFPQTAGAKREDPYEGVLHLLMDGSFPVREVHAHFEELRGIRTGRTRAGRAEEEESQQEAERHGARIEINVVTQGKEGLETKESSFDLWEDERLILHGRGMRPRLPATVVTPYDHWRRALPVHQFSEAGIAGFRDEVLSLLRDLDDRISGIEILAPTMRPALYLRDKVAGLAPLSAFGDGFRRTLLIALALPQVAGGVLLIDELETAIHVSALHKVFRWLLAACRKHDVQLFATTHSLEAIDAILQEDVTPEEDIVGFRLERTAGQTHAKRYGEGLLKRLRNERGLDVR